MIILKGLKGKLIFVKNGTSKTRVYNWKVQIIKVQPVLTSQKILFEGQSGPYNPFVEARYFLKGPMYLYLSNMQKRTNS